MSAMVEPTIRYYAVLTLSTAKGRKTPKFTITAQTGFYPPMEELKGRDGNVSMYLNGKIKEGANVPSMRLQAKDSLNFTGLKEYFTDGGKLSGFAYGYPDSHPTYSKKGKPNPFTGYKQDGFLFVVHQNPDAPTDEERQMPTKIELIVLAGAKVLIPSLCKRLMIGGYDAELEQLRKLAEQPSEPKDGKCTQ